METFVKCSQKLFQDKVNRYHKIACDFIDWKVIKFGKDGGAAKIEDKFLPKVNTHSVIYSKITNRMLIGADVYTDNNGRYIVSYSVGWICYLRKGE